MKIKFTDEFKDKVAGFIVGTSILLFFLLLYGFVGGVEMGMFF